MWRLLAELFGFSPAKDGGFEVGDSLVEESCGGSGSLEALLQGAVLRCKFADALVQGSVAVWVPESRPSQLSWGFVGRYLPG
jgi:hypothetical protein